MRKLNKSNISKFEEVNCPDGNKTERAGQRNFGEVFDKFSQIERPKDFKVNAAFGISRQWDLLKRHGLQIFSRKMGKS